MTVPEIRDALMDLDQMFEELMADARAPTPSGAAIPASGVQAVTEAAEGYLAASRQLAELSRVTPDVRKHLLSWKAHAAGLRGLLTMYGARDSSQTTRSYSAKRVKEYFFWPWEAHERLQAVTEQWAKLVESSIAPNGDDLIPALTAAVVLEEYQLFSAWRRALAPMPAGFNYAMVPALNYWTWRANIAGKEIAAAGGMPPPPLVEFVNAPAAWAAERAAQLAKSAAAAKQEIRDVIDRAKQTPQRLEDAANRAADELKAGIQDGAGAFGAAAGVVLALGFLWMMRTRK